MELRLIGAVSYLTTMLVCALATGNCCCAPLTTEARVMARSLGPEALAWKVRTQTTPVPEMPCVPGGREMPTTRFPAGWSA